jgi:hypothetical protein
MLVEGFTTFVPLDLAMFSSCSVSARAVYICIDLSNAPAFYCMYCIVFTIHSMPAKILCLWEIRVCCLYQSAKFVIVYAAFYCMYCIVLYLYSMPAKILWEIRVCCLYQSAKFVIV